MRGIEPGCLESSEDSHISHEVRLPLQLGAELIPLPAYGMRMGWSLHHHAIHNSRITRGAFNNRDQMVDFP